jgi:prepilin-type N-terminal cleavage/methylation domain-containing protein
MTAQHHRKRRGLTLTEVLVSIFILAIGLTALLALFPIGALQMAQAMKDDRAATCAANADRLFRIWWKEAWLDDSTGNLLPETPPNYNVTVAGNQRVCPRPPSFFCYPLNTTIYANYAFGRQPAFAFMDDRSFMDNRTFVGDPAVTLAQYSGLLPNGQRGNLINVAENSQPITSTNFNRISKWEPYPSFPVYLDPIGFVNQLGLGLLARHWVGGGAGSRSIPRKDIVARRFNATPQNLQANTAARLRNCTLLDDFDYSREDTREGLASDATGPVKRLGKFNYGWMIQRPKNSIRHEVNLSVIVYFNRPPTDTAAEELVFADPIPTVTVNSNIVILPYTGGRPPVRRGTWILNATNYTVEERLQTTGAIVARYQRQMADFYRVIDVVEGNNVLELEVQVPVRGPQAGLIGNNIIRTVTGSPVVMVLSNVAEVFDRGTVSAFDKPAP